MHTCYKAVPSPLCRPHQGGMQAVMFCRSTSTDTSLSEHADRTVHLKMCCPSTEVYRKGLAFLGTGGAGHALNTWCGVAIVAHSTGVQLQHR